MERYDSYKDSGVQWLGEIPSHWKLVKIKHFYQMQSGFTPSSHHSEYYSEDTSNTWVTIGDMKSKILIESKNHISDMYIRNFKPSIIPQGSLLYSFKLSVGTVGFAGRDLYSNEAIMSFLPSKDVNLNFLYYSAPFCIINNANTNIYGAKILNQDLIKNALVIFPPLEEQEAIVEYLDKATYRIDGTIKQQQEIIDLLNERKQIIINQAVCRGLNPDAPMKDSGIDWIGEIPKHWETKRLGYSAWIRARLGWKGLKADEYVDNGYGFLSAFNIINNKLDWTNLNYITKYRYDESPEIKLSVGDILLVKDGAGIGKCARVDELPKGEATANGSLAFITPFDDVDYRFLYYYLISNSFNNYKDLLITGMGVPHLTQSEMKKMRMPIPPIKEQKEIAEFLDARIGKLDKGIDLHQLQIERLQERKQIIINEVITGKVKVS